MSSLKQGTALLEARHLKKQFLLSGRAGIFSRRRMISAVDGVEININKGEILGLAGESGSGKTTVARLLTGLLRADEGSILFEGIELTNLSPSQLFRMRRNVQFIFQDPASSLNPRMKVGSIISEPLVVHRIGNSASRREKVLSLMREVGLSEDLANRYPNELSGGQRQRVGIARALALQPKFIVADEPVSSLDVSIQAQVLNLIKSIHQKFSLSVLFISHDISVLRAVCESIAVMYMGKIVEVGRIEDIINNPKHPYTQSLIASVPVPNPREPHATHVSFIEPVNTSNYHSGCKFAPRCPFVMEICRQANPNLFPIDNISHLSACFLHYDRGKNG